MYGTVARMRLKPGVEDEFTAQLREYEALRVPGFVRSTLYRLDADSRDVIMAVVFESREQYVANAESPEQHVRYGRMRDLLESDPEWNDGEIVGEMTAGS